MYEILKNVLKYYSLQNLISLIKDKNKKKESYPAQNKGLHKEWKAEEKIKLYCIYFNLSKMITV